MQGLSSPSSGGARYHTLALALAAAAAPAAAAAAAAAAIVGRGCGRGPVQQADDDDGCRGRRSISCGWGSRGGEEGGGGGFVYGGRCVYVGTYGGGGW